MSVSIWICLVSIICTSQCPVFLLQKEPFRLHFLYTIFKWEVEIVREMLRGKNIPVSKAKLKISRTSVLYREAKKK